MIGSAFGDLDTSRQIDHLFPISYDLYDLYDLYDQYDLAHVCCRVGIVTPARPIDTGFLGWIYARMQVLRNFSQRQMKHQMTYLWMIYL